MAAWIATLCALIWVVCCTFFSFVERPGINADRWASSLLWYHRMSTRLTPALVALVFIGSGAAIYAWSQSDDLRFLGGALVMLVMFPMSAVFVVTDSRDAMESRTDVYGEILRKVFRRWFYVHIVRTILAIIALISFLRALGLL